MAQTLGQRYKRAFFTGLAALLPTILTIGVLVFCWNVLNEYVAQKINTGLRYVLKTEISQEYYWEKLWNLQPWQLDDELPVPSEASEAQRVSFEDRVDAHVPTWLGLVLAVVLVLVLGFMLKGYLGRQALRLLESWIRRIPVIKVIYPYAKQLTEFFFEGRRPIQYESAVAVQYPRKGIYAIGFVTNEGFKDVEAQTGVPMVTIFIPSSPTPITGYTIVVPKSDVVPVDLSIDEALRFTVSAGVLLPAGQLPPLALKTRKLKTADEAVPETRDS